MSLNSSSFTDLLPSQPSYANSSVKCLKSRRTVFILSALSMTYILLIPVFILVLYLGYQQRRHRRSVSTAAASHSDLFTYHSTAMQLNEILGVTLFCFGSHFDLLELMIVGLSVCSVTSVGQALCHLITCVEHYLAVVHPVTYMGLRQSRGVRIRNITIGCVWLLSFSWLAESRLGNYVFHMIMYFVIMVLFLTVICFCSISVLCALRHPGPGEVGGNRERVDQSKRRAFHTILVIMGVFLLGFGGNLTINVMYCFSVLDVCNVLASLLWFDLPSRLVLPLLFLHRAGKLQCCNGNTESV